MGTNDQNNRLSSGGNSWFQKNVKAKAERNQLLNPNNYYNPNLGLPTSGGHNSGYGSSNYLSGASTPNRSKWSGNKTPKDPHKGSYDELVDQRMEDVMKA